MKQARITHWTWGRVVPQILFLATLIVVINLILPSELAGLSGLVGIFVFVVYYRMIRAVLVGQHRRGLKAMDKQRLREGIVHFEKCYDFLNRHSWIDKYRSIVLLEPSVMEYREMALMNIAFAHFKLDNLDEARDWYERTLAEYPNNQIIKDTLKLIGDK